MRTPLWLVGMMGAGKTAVGQVLAHQLGLSFQDADAEIEQTAGCPVSEIFEQEGEAGFRKREFDAIQRLSRSEGVVSLGGGALTQSAVLDLVGQGGQLIYLRATAETLARRIGGDGDRPLVAGLDQAGREERLESLLSEREAAYERATVIVDTDGRNVSEVADCIAAALEQDS